jgi:hypothetical protein
MDEKVIRAARALLDDINSMWSHADRDECFFGPFSEGDEDSHGFYVSWPNLEISRERLEKALESIDANV